MADRPIAALSGSAGTTRRIAAAIAACCREGDVILLNGELGAGKTVFVQGFVAALGYEGPVTSPTFVLVQHYPGRLPIVHADTYRLENASEVLDLDLPALGAGGVLLVEWGEAAEDVVGPDRLEVSIEVGGEDERRIEIHPRGRSWEDRCESLSAAMRAVL